MRTFRLPLNIFFRFLVTLAFVCRCTGLTCGMYRVTLAVFLGLSHSYYATVVLWCFTAVCAHGGRLSQEMCCIFPPLSTGIVTLFTPRHGISPLKRVHVTRPLISMRDSPREGFCTAIFVLPTAASSKGERFHAFQEWLAPLRRSTEADKQVRLSVSGLDG